MALDASARASSGSWGCSNGAARKLVTCSRTGERWRRSWTSTSRTAALRLLRSSRRSGCRQRRARRRSAIPATKPELHRQNVDRPFGASPHPCGLTSVRSKFKADDQDTTTTCCFGETPPETRLPVQPPPLHTIQWLPTSLPISSGRPLAATTPSWSSAPRPVVSSSPRTRSTSRTSTRGRSVCFHQLGWLRKLQLPEYEEETHR